MRILMLTQWFNPEPFFKGLPFAMELVRLGHEVEVLTGFPNYPGGKVYEGYRIKAYQRETMDGIEVLRVPLYPSHDTSSMHRITNYASFALSSSIIGSLLVKSADVMYVYQPPATVGFPAWIIHLSRRIPFVYDIQDLWPDTLGSTGMVNNRAALWIVDKWCSFMYKQASKIVVLSPGFKDALCKRGVSEDKIEVIYNWCDESNIRPGERDDDLARTLGFYGRFNVVFAGTMGKAQALDSVLNAAQLLDKRVQNIQFVFVGGGIDAVRLQQRAKEMQLRNVLFLPQRSISEIGSILNLADILLVHLKKDPLFKITIPSKIQAYMAVGRPILVGGGGDSASLVEKAGAGISCPPEDPQGMADAVEKLFTMPLEKLAEMGNNGKKVYESELSLSVGVRKFERIFNLIVH